MKKTLTDKEKIEFIYLIRLVSSAINGFPIPLPNDSINLNSVFNLAKYCGLDAICSNLLLSLPRKYVGEPELIKALAENKNVQLMVDINLDNEINRVIKAFEENKIKNMPLKGYYMKQYYPRSDYRSVSDFDILFDISQIDEVKRVFSDLGFTFLKNDDTQYHFEKKPYTYIEMHRDLLHEHEHCYKYLKNQLDNSTKRKGYEYSYEMSLEDYYLYMIIHHSNHFRIGGIGLRMILDVYVFYKKFSKKLNIDYISEKLKVYKLDIFEKRIRQIAFNWFSTAKPKMNFDELEVFLLLSSIMGRKEANLVISSQKIEKNGRKKSKVRFLLDSIFPNRKAMKVYYHYLDKHPYLLPISWCSMWGKRFFVEKNVHIKSGLKNRLAYTDDDVSYMKNLLRDVGFDDIKD